MPKEGPMTSSVAKSSQVKSRLVSPHLALHFGNCPSPVHSNHCKAQGESYDEPKYMEISMCLLATEGSYAYYSLRVRGILNLQINVNNFLEFPFE